MQTQSQLFVSIRSDAPLSVFTEETLGGVLVTGLDALRLDTHEQLVPVTDEDGLIAEYRLGKMWRLQVLTDGKWCTVYDAPWQPELACGGRRLQLRDT